MDASNLRQPFILEPSEKEQGNTPAKARQAGDICPKCGQERLDYDGMLNLTCAACGYSEAGCFT